MNKVKPGKYTTEFWIAAATVLLPQIQGLFQPDDSEYKALAFAASVLAAAVASFGYSLSRAKAKSE